MSEEKERVLVIRLGALGDLVFCFQSFHEIRAAHPDAEIALLTRAPFAVFAEAMPWFDRVIVETHPEFAEMAAWARLRREIKDFAPTRIYDLQGKNRQTILYALLGGPFGPEWSGAAPLCKFPRPPIKKGVPPAPAMSFTDFLAAQLRVAGVPAQEPPDLRWLDAQVGKFALPENYVVLVPGCSPAAPHKRWPPRHYAALANKLRTWRFACVAVGATADADAAEAIKTAAPDVVDLSGQTNLFELAGVLRRADGVIGNDTGPLHLAASLGAPTLALFSGRSDPAWSKPPGRKVAVRQSRDLVDLTVDEALAAFGELLQNSEN